ncbi:MAG TPA: hypothetical protein VJ487_21015, partial [Alphaproteobacteria bacterium]|nr:hypothetical protein [Alphaproteobacteria bacterium]
VATAPAAARALERRKLGNIQHIDEAKDSAERLAADAVLRLVRQLASLRAVPAYRPLRSLERHANSVFQPERPAVTRFFPSSRCLFCRLHAA